MNIRCPNCQTVFRVDPAKVPPDGIRAKCSRCGYAFRVAPPGTPPSVPIAGAGGVAAARRPAAAPVSAAPPPPAAPAPVSAAPPPPAAPAPLRPPPPPPPPAGRAPAVAAATVERAPAVPTRTPVFGSHDPKDRARRIARALVSDIVAYHKKRVEETLASGRIRTEFRDEILKSWEEYVAQVGPDLAKGTPFFRDALNEILARGQRVF
jgi:predicted Zn finger-like uncharacterized protein